MDPNSAHTISGKADNIVVGLNAVVVAWDEESPAVLIVEDHASDVKNALPFGPFQPELHRTLETGIRSWVEDQTGLDLGYVEQLYTFGDRGRDPQEEAGGPRFISIGYLALVKSKAKKLGDDPNLWKDWYSFFPWEDWRDGKPDLLSKEIEPRLENWANSASSEAARHLRLSRIQQNFGKDSASWNDELVLERYELLYEANLIHEALRGQNTDMKAIPSKPMSVDHRRILATGIGRLRSKIKYRPVVFELMPPSFTLLQLQRLVEALSGKRLHKQNFRRLLENTQMLKPTGEISTQTGGRPAKLYSFRTEVIAERQSPLMKLPALPASMT